MSVGQRRAREHGHRAEADDVAEDAAKQKGIKTIFLLSTRAFNYFQQKGGYKEGSPADLPPARRERYEASGRNSKVLVKRLE